MYIVFKLINFSKFYRMFFLPCWEVSVTKINVVKIPSKFRTSFFVKL